MVSQADYDKAFDRYKTRKGRCYQLAGQHMLDGKAPEGSVLVHGQAAFMPSHLPQVPFDHAWVEYPDGSVWEPISKLHLTAEEWEAIAMVGYWKAEAEKQGWPISEQRYTHAEMCERITATKHWGAWFPGEGVTND